MKGPNPDAAPAPISTGMAFVLADAARRAPHGLFGQVRARQAMFRLRLGDFTHARQFAQQSLAVCRQHGIQEDRLIPLWTLAWVACFQGAYADAEQLLHEPLAICDACNNAWGKATSPGILGLTVYGLGA